MGKTLGNLEKRLDLLEIEQLQARMARNGIRPEDNEFSRAIIAEREK